MKIGIIGLGKMGASIALRVKKAGYEVYGFDVDQRSFQQLESAGISITATVQELASRVQVIWLMVPAGSLVDDVIEQIVPVAQQNCIIIDGGNSFYKDSIRRARNLDERGFVFLDCGTSGGIHGLKHGFCLMVGGDTLAVQTLSDLFTEVAAPEGFAHVGPSGAGHYVKMVHNGIEYGILQAYAEGFELLQDGSFKNTPLDLKQIASLWNHGSVIRSFILELAEDIYKQETQSLENIQGIIEEGGTGRWMAQEAAEHKVSVPVLQASLDVRTQSRITGGTYATRLIALLRKAFGGHRVLKAR